MSGVWANWAEPSGYAPIAPIERRMRSHSAVTQATGSNSASGQRPPRYIARRTTAKSSENGTNSSARANGSALLNSENGPHTMIQKA